MRIAVFSDVHGNRPALNAVLRDIKRQGADAVVCLGDLAYKGPQPGECVELVRSLGMPDTYPKRLAPATRLVLGVGPCEHPASWRLLIREVPTSIETQPRTGRRRYRYAESCEPGAHSIL
jgi:3',5'-cyclic AMP phosphodiesterase CpdA